MASAAQSLGCRTYGHFGHLYGGARHLHRERRAAAYRGLAGRLAGGGDMGADQLPGQLGHHPSHLGLDLEPHWTQALLHDVRGPVHGLLHAVRSGADAAHAGGRAHPAGASAAADWRSSEQAILADTFPIEKRRAGLRPLRHGGRGRARPSAPRWAAGLRTTSTGIGSSSSTCPSG